MLLRKLGLATLALREATQWFKKHNIAHVDLSVDARNHVGVQAWKKLGFIEWRLILRKRV